MESEKQTCRIDFRYFIHNVTYKMEKHIKIIYLTSLSYVNFLQQFNITTFYKKIIIQTNLILVQQFLSLKWTKKKSKTNVIYSHYHHHHVMPLARISLTLSRYFSLSFIASGRSSGLHRVSLHSCCIYVLAGRSALAPPHYNKNH